MPGVDDFFRIERAELDDVLRLHDGQFRRRRHDRIEIARRRAVGQIAPAVRLPGLDQRDVAGQRFFEQIFAAADFALFLAGGELGADRGRGDRRPECRRRRRACVPPWCPAARSRARSCRRDKAPRTPPDRRCADRSRRSCARGRDSRSRARPTRPTPALLETTVRSLAPCSIRPSISALGWPMLPKPPSSTTEPSRMPAIASAMICTILLIIGNAYSADDAQPRTRRRNAGITSRAKRRKLSLAGQPGRRR